MLGNFFAVSFPASGILVVGVGFGDAASSQWPNYGREPHAGSKAAPFVVRCIGRRPSRN